jgi:SsrA-binding protein
MADLLHNRKASFDYYVEDTYEAGIELSGIEVKSIRAGRGALEGAHVIIRGGEAFVVGMKVDPYQPKNTAEDYDPLRTRKLLLSKKEIRTLERQAGVKGLTLIVVSIYSKGPKLKAKVAVAKGKKSHDKRAVINKRETDREIRREFKHSAR